MAGRTGVPVSKVPAALTDKEEHMPRYLMLVETNPVSSQCETEYNDWYDDTHIPDVLKVDGFVAATRYRVADVQLVPGEPPTHRYLAIYEVDTDDLDTAVKALAEAAGGGMFISDSLQMEPFPGVTLFEEIAPRQTCLSGGNV